MTEEEVLQAMETFKSAIISLKEENRKLKEENINLKNTTNSYNSKLIEKINEIQNILNS